MLEFHRRNAARARLPAIGPRDRRASQSQFSCNGAPSPAIARGRRMDPAGSITAQGAHRQLRLADRREGREAAHPSRAAHRRCRGGAPTCWPSRTSKSCCRSPARLHRQRRALHAAGARRFDDRCRHLGSRLRRGTSPARGRNRATSSLPESDGEEGTVKRYRRSDGQVILEPANADHRPIIRPANEVTIFGKVVTVIRRL